MERKELNIIICALITTIADLQFADLGVSEGILYAGLMNRVDHSTFSDVVELLITSGMIERKPGPVLVATAKGRALADKASAAVGRPQ